MLYAARVPPSQTAGPTDPVQCLSAAGPDNAALEPQPHAAQPGRQTGHDSFSLCFDVLVCKRGKSLFFPCKGRVRAACRARLRSHPQ